MEGAKNMGMNPKYTDRNGMGKQMTKRQVRLTDDENEQLNEILNKTGTTLRDLIAELINERWMEEFK